jgi:uncharacterized membrane protein
VEATLDIVEERFAEGDISKEEQEHMKNGFVYI